MESVFRRWAVNAAPFLENVKSLTPFGLWRSLGFPRLEFEGRRRHSLCLRGSVQLVQQPLYSARVVLRSVSAPLHSSPTSDENRSFQKRRNVAASQHS
jgi:hypothetical protein